MALNYDTKSTNSLTGDSRSAAGTFTNSDKSIPYLWSSLTLPWVASYFPWVGIVTGQVLTLDTRN